MYLCLCLRPAASICRSLVVHIKFEALQCDLVSVWCHCRQSAQIILKTLWVGQLHHCQWEVVTKNTHFTHTHTQNDAADWSILPKCHCNNSKRFSVVCVHVCTLDTSGHAPNETMDGVLGSLPPPNLDQGISEI